MLDGLQIQEIIWEPREIATGLANLSLSDTNKPLMIEHGLVPLVHRLLLEEKEDPKAIQLGCKILANLSFSDNILHLSQVRAC